MEGSSLTGLARPALVAAASDRHDVPVDTLLGPVLGTVVGALLILALAAVAVVAHQRSPGRLGRRTGAVTPTPAGEDDPLRLEFHPDGTPRAVRIRGPH